MRVYPPGREVDRSPLREPCIPLAGIVARGGHCRIHGEGFALEPGGSRQRLRASTASLTVTMRECASVDKEISFPPEPATINGKPEYLSPRDKTELAGRQQALRVSA